MEIIKPIIPKTGASRINTGKSRIKIGSNSMKTGKSSNPPTIRPITKRVPVTTKPPPIGSTIEVSSSDVPNLSAAPDSLPSPQAAHIFSPYSLRMYSPF